MRILVTAAGAGPAVAVIKALRSLPRSDVFVLAVDLSPASAGLYLANDFAIVPAARPSEPYLQRLLNLCQQHRIEMVIPILDMEVEALAGVEGEFQAAGTSLAINPFEAIRLSLNKPAACQHVSSVVGIPATFASPAQAAAQDYPLIGRPVCGTGSRNSLFLNSPDDQDGSHSLDLFWQSFIPGDEYSIDTFGHPDSDLFVAVPRHRRLIRAGQMVQGTTVADPELIHFARQVIRKFGCDQVCCLQVIRSSVDDRLYFIELNPRYGTGVSLSIAAGVPFPLLQWQQMCDPRALPREVPFVAGVEMLRYWSEVFRHPDARVCDSTPGDKSLYAGILVPKTN